MMDKHINRRQSFHTGAAVLVISTAIVKIIGALFKIPLSNLLGDEGAGYFSSAYDFFTPFYALAMSGLPVAAARMIAAFSSEGRYKDIKQFEKITHRLFWGIGSVGIVLFILMIPLFMFLTDDLSNSKYGLIAIAPAVLLFCGMSYYRGVFEGMENMTPTAVSDMIEAGCKLVLGYGFAWITLKLTFSKVYASAAALLGITIGVGAATLYLVIRYRRYGDGIESGELNGSPEACPRERLRTDFITMMFPITASAVLVTVFASLADAITVQSSLRAAGFDNAVALYGIRSKAFTLYNLIPSVTAVIGISAVPKLSAAFAAGKTDLIKKHTTELLKLVAVIAIPAGVGLFTMAKPIMTLLYTSKNAGGIGAELLEIYGGAAVFTGLSVAVIHALQALGRQKIAIIILSFGMALKLVLNIIFVSDPNIGLVGCAYSTFYAYLLVFCVGLAFLMKTSGIDRLRSIFLKPYFASFVCIPAGLAARYFDSDLITAVSISAAVVLYFVMIFAFKTFTAEEIEAFPGGEKLVKLLFKHKKAQ